MPGRSETLAACPAPIVGSKREIDMAGTILEMKHITKQFPGVLALDDVSFSVEAGEVHALVGENGAGKSTLMKILNGVYQADSGEIYVEEEKVTLKNVLQAQQKGISIIYQEFNLVPQLSVAENIFIGRLRNKKAPVVNWKLLNQKAKKILDDLNYSLNPKQIAGELSVAQMQMLEIAKALSYDAKIIIMDEPSAVLTENELIKLFEIVKDLKQRGVTVVYISHRLEEIFRICDRVTILRDGKVIETKRVQDIKKEEIIESMVGRKMEQEFPKRVKSDAGEVILKVEGLKRGKKVKDVSFDLRKGEILGLAGLVGAGRTESARLIFGADKTDEGNIAIKGEKVLIKSPYEGKKLGIALLPEDRKEQGLLLEMSLSANIVLSSLGKIKDRFKMLSEKVEKKIATEYISSLNIKAPSTKQHVGFLSGGNQQKVVVAKWLFADADIIILDEPTRGIDVGTKYEIYLLMNRLIEQGKSIILISSELNEIVALSDRVVVIHEGRLRAILEKDDVSAENILTRAIG